GKRLSHLITTIKRYVQQSSRISIAQGRQEVPAARAAIDTYWRSLNAGQAYQVKALHQDVTNRVQAGIIPDHTHRPELVAYCQAWEVVHREAVIARNVRKLQRGDGDCIDGFGATTG